MEFRGKHNIIQEESMQWTIIVEAFQIYDLFTLNSGTSSPEISVYSLSADNVGPLIATHFSSDFNENFTVLFVSFYSVYCN